MSDVPGIDTTQESTDMVQEPQADDPADMAGEAAAGTADQMHDEVDEIAERTGDTTPGHGPNV